MDLLGSRQFKDDVKDSSPSPIAKKLDDANSLTDFELKISKTLKPESISSPNNSSRKPMSLLDSIKEALDKANKKIQFQEESFRNMRYSYLKELQAYRDQLFKLEKYPENFEPINVQFFSGLEILDEKTREVLDRKISLITDDFNFKLLRLQKYNMKMEDKILKFEKLCKGKNIAVSIHELNADDIIHKLSIIESDSLPIWEAFSKHYGNGFFNKMIEKEFGINPDTHEEIGNKFGQEVNNIRIEMNAKFESLSNEAKDHIELLKKKMRQAQTEALAVKEDHEDEIAKIKEEIFKE